MENNFALSAAGTQPLADLEALRSCNAYTGRYGLSLSEEQIRSLVTARFEALRNTGRIEFGEGILPKLVYAFCDSPFIMQESYEETLAALQDAFYYFKNESEDRFSDDELIGFMKTVFNGIAQGSIDYLSGTSLENLCRAARHETLGTDPDHDFLF